MQSGRAYYNENDAYAAQWLHNLISEGLIAPGDVDDRSIADVKPDDLAGYTQCHFFAGIGGWSLALRNAGWDDSRPVWSGSCPCQPFSVAGKRAGFDDKRHLWPFFRNLIAQCSPPVVFGEQVAAASDWLRLVRSDLEALEYAVGCAPIEAASAGADHLRDRYWFVADDQSIGRREGRPEHEVRCGRDTTAEHGGQGVALGDAYDPRSQGRSLSAEGAGERTARSPSMADADADADVAGEGERREQRGGQFGRSCGDSETCALGDGSRLAEREPHHEGDVIADGGQAQSVSGGAGDHLDWVIGADGKARRVKSGIRLLAHGVPARVGKLRAFGNAIDPRPAAQFIGAYMDFCIERELLQ